MTPTSRGASPTSFAGAPDGLARRHSDPHVAPPRQDVQSSRMGLVAKIRSAGWLSAALAIGGLLAADDAGAAVTFGSDLSKPPDTELADCADRCTYVQDQLAGVSAGSPSRGVLVRWRVRAADATPVRLRMVEAGAVRASSETFVPTGGGAVDTVPARLPITPGVRLALDHDGTQALHALAPGSGARLHAYDPALQDTPGPNASTRQDLDDLELLVNADVEPDRDRDGFGDETQDACPTDATTTRVCPADLSVTIGGAQFPVAVGGDLDFIVRFRRGDNQPMTPNARFTLAVAAGGAQVASVQLFGQGACALGIPLVCSFGDLLPGSPWSSASVKLRPTIAGQLTVVGTVASDAPETNSGDNVATRTVTVLAAGACANPSTGTAGPDRLRGTAYGDRLLGRGGADVLRGGLGADCLVGGAGDDALVGGAGGDELAGGPGDDHLRGDAGADVLRGGPGVDRLDGGTGGDRLDSRDGRREIVHCGLGRDRVRADRRDRLIGCERKRLGGRG